MGIPVGTRSLLWGAHQFALHPIFVALAWRRLYGRWPRQPQIWVAFVVHDWGYLGRGDMDGKQGAYHPWRGAALMGRWFDKRGGRAPSEWAWFNFAAGHSRTYADLIRVPTSDLMAVDKLATVLMPLPLYAGLCWLSGEWLEYRDRWVASGRYPGRPDDGVLAWARHLRANWKRFERADAVAGRAYGHE